MLGLHCGTNKHISFVIKTVLISDKADIPLRVKSKESQRYASRYTYKDTDTKGVHCSFDNHDL